MEKKYIIWIAFISIFILIMFFYSNSINSFQEGATTIKESTQNIILNALKQRFNEEYNPTGATDAELKELITIDDGSEDYKKCIGIEDPTQCIDCFENLFGINNDFLEKELYVRYTFASDTMIIKNNTYFFKNTAKQLTKNNIDPSIYDAVIHQGKYKPQHINTLVSTDTPIVNGASLHLKGEKRTVPITELIVSEVHPNGYSADNAAYLSIPKLPNFYDENSNFLGMGISFWFQAGPDNGVWTRLIDFAENRDSKNLLISPSYGGSKFLAFGNVIGHWDPGWYIEWFDNTDNEGTMGDGFMVCDNVWRHFVLTINKNGVASFYINNKVIKKRLNSKPSIGERTRNYIGKSNWNSEPTTSSAWHNDDIFNGKIADFRVYRRPLEESDINKLYNMGNKEILNKPFTTNFFGLNNSRTDTGTEPVGQLTMVGNVQHQTFNSRACVYFQNSTNNYFYFPLKTEYAKNFTFGYWMNTTDSTYSTIASITDDTNTRPSWQCDLEGGKILTFIATPNWWQTRLGYNYNHLNKWTHVAFTFNNTNKARVYINGKLVNSGQGASALAQGTSRIVIGRSGDGGAQGRGYNGYLHGFFFANKVLTNHEINGIMALSNSLGENC